MADGKRKGKKSKKSKRSASVPLISDIDETNTEEFGDFQEAEMMEQQSTSTAQTPTSNPMSAVKIPPPPTKQSSVAPNATEEESTSNAPVETCTELCIRFLGYLDPYNNPDHAEVAMTAYKYFQQEGMVVRRMRLGAETIYKFSFLKPVPKVGNSLRFMEEGEMVDVPLYEWEDNRNEEKKRGTLLTFKQANEGMLKLMPPKEFDKAIQTANLTLIIPTKLQHVKNARRTFNGNRYCVVDTPDDMKTIPTSISLRHPVNGIIYPITVDFYGKEVFCDRCSAFHTTRCPELVEFYAAVEERKEMVKTQQIKSKVYGDSTLRHMDPLGLRSEVSAMSGGGLGQVIQASLDDPTNMYDNNIIFGGTNDIKDQNFPTNEAFAANVDASLQKLETAANGVPEKKFYLAQQQPIREDEGNAFPDTDRRIRELYLKESYQILAEKVDNVETIPIRYEVDATGHPTEEGTRCIIDQLDTMLPSQDLIWNERHIYSESAYRRVEGIYRYGCNKCLYHGKKISREKNCHQLLCDKCHDEVVLRAKEPNQLLNDITVRVVAANERRFQKNFPPSKRTKLANATSADDLTVG